MTISKQKDKLLTSKKNITISTKTTTIASLDLLYKSNLKVP